MFEFEGYSGMVVPLNDTSISNWDPDQIRGKALFISLASVISMNSTVESVLFTVLFGRMNYC